MTPPLSVADRSERSLDVTAAGRFLFRYVYAPLDPVAESPRPYCHPIRTLAGRLVTVFQPEDHPWHHGLSLTATDVNGANFWGGGTFVDPAAGYRDLDNQGTVRHDAWDAPPGTEGALAHRLTWLTRAGEPLLTEARRLAVAGLDAEAGWWALDWRSVLTNPGRAPAVFSSPGAKGRDSGYGGLFWRGPASFTGGRILAAGGAEGPGVMGQPGPWLAFVAPAADWLTPATLVFVQDPGNPALAQTKWFTRTAEFACAAPTFMYDRTWTLAPGASATFAYRVFVSDRTLDREGIELMLKEGAS